MKFAAPVALIVICCLTALPVSAQTRSYNLDLNLHSDVQGHQSSSQLPNGPRPGSGSTQAQSTNPQKRMPKPVINKTPPRPVRTCAGKPC